MADAKPKIEFLSTVPGPRDEQHRLVADNVESRISSLEAQIQSLIAAVQALGGVINEGIGG